MISPPKTLKTQPATQARGLLSRPRAWDKSRLRLGTKWLGAAPRCSRKTLGRYRMLGGLGWTSRRRVWVAPRRRLGARSVFRGTERQRRDRRLDAPPATPQ